MTAIPIVLAAIAAVVWFLLRKKAAVMPPGRVVYSDTSRRAINEPITSHRLQLNGKPDYIYSLPDQVVPLEVKRHRAGRFGPRDRDVMQLLTYCVLVEDGLSGNNCGIGIGVRTVLSVESHAQRQRCSRPLYRYLARSTVVMDIACHQNCGLHSPHAWGRFLRLGCI